MKKCSYCGAEYPDDALVCAVDQTPFDAERAAMRDSVKSFLSLGALPSEAAAVEVIKRHEDALLAIPRPVSLAEANALAEMFGPDDCFGLSWTLVHLIESVPDWSSRGRIPAGGKPGLRHLRTGIENERKLHA
jgi:hypothetical protein